MVNELSFPLTDANVLALRVGDPVSLSGRIVTGRDAAHKWLVETFIQRSRQPVGDDPEVYAALKPLLNGSAIYHCGPVVAGLESQNYRFVAAGPTTSIREEPYQAEVMRHFNLKGVIGKGGMAAKTLRACQEVPAVYFHAIGGAASLIAQSVKSVMGVYKLGFGVPEAFWVIDVRGLPAVVTMDAHGASLHAAVRERSGAVLEQLLK